MLMQYIVPLLITLLLAIFGIVLAGGFMGSAETAVEIIVYGDENAEQIENTVMLAKEMAKRYFKNANVYIKGGEGAHLDVLCRRYNVLRKE